MKKKTQAVIFDVGDVLALSKKSLKKFKGKTFHIGVHEDISKKLKISLDQYFDSIDSTYAKSMEGKISLKETLEFLSKNLKISKTKLKQIFFNTYKKHFKQNNQLFKKARLLKKRGYKLAILSDQWHLSKEVVMPKNLYDFFDVLVVSCDVGIRKPNPEIYLDSCRRLKLPADECIAVEDSPIGIESAKSAGIKCLALLTEYHIAKDLKKADFVVHDLKPKTINKILKI